MSLNSSGLVVMMTLIGGGLVSFWGPLIGAAIFFVARDALGALHLDLALWYGLMFMAIVLLKPEGIAGSWQNRRAVPRRSRPRRRRATRGGRWPHSKPAAADALRRPRRAGGHLAHLR
jgi:branched-chain amino acid transport system permease protein